MQQGDVKLYQTNDGGDMNVVNGLVEMTPGLETAVYLSLFGGNEQDDGSARTPHQWWGNLDEEVEERKYRSRTQYALDNYSPVPANLKRLVDAAKLDLDWFVSTGVASEVTVSATMPGRNRVTLTVSVAAEGVESAFSFTENWKASA